MILKSHIFSFIAAVIIAVSLPVTLAATRSEWLWIGLGAAAWCVGVGLKIPLSILIAVAVRGRGDVFRNTCLGLISAAAELGVAAATLVYFSPSTPSIVDLTLFSSAAGATELLVVALGSLLVSANPAEVAQWEESARSSALVRHRFFLERIIALVGHTGSRGLIGLSVGMSSGVGAVCAATIAVVGFSATDGIAGYGQARAWDWSDPALCTRVFGLFAGIAAIELAAFLLFASLMT